MDESPPRQLISYMAPAAPATRRPATGDEPFLRPEIGFTPNWYRQAIDVDFGRQWHSDPTRRMDGIAAMNAELQRRFPDASIGRLDDSLDQPPDLLTGTFGACAIAAIYGMDIVYAADNWPDTVGEPLAASRIEALEPPDLDASPFFGALMDQADSIEKEVGPVRGYVNWQGVLNNAFRLRGQDIFADMLLEPNRARHLFECIARTMADASARLYERQGETGFDVEHFTVSNCLVNMIGPDQYAEFLQCYDRGFAEAFGIVGIHNCAWNADPYIDHYSAVPNVAYIDMGMDSNLARARDAFPDARRAVMYTPMDLAGKDLTEIRSDFQRCARDFGPCDMVLADIEADTPDQRVLDAVRICQELSRTA